MEKKMSKTVFALAMAIVMFTASPLAAQVLYDLTDLGQGGAYSINNSGQVVGTAGYPSWELPDGSFLDAPHAVIFDSTGNGSNIYLGEGTAYSINSSGQVVGQLGIFVNQQYAALFDPADDGNNFDLRILSDNGDSCAYSINDNGQIVGSSGGAVLFDPTGDGNNIDLGNGKATSINDNGRIVGISSDPLPSPLPFPFPGPSLSFNSATLFDPTGTGNNLNLDPSNPSFLDYSEATSINNYGQIVGYAVDQDSVSTSTTTMQSDFQVAAPPDIPTLIRPSSISSPPLDGNGPVIIIDPNGIIWPPAFISYPHATLFDPTGDGNNIDLGTLPGGVSSYAHSINDNSKIVGYAYTSSGKKHAVMFDSTGGGDNVDLNELIDPALGWTLTEARCINDNGWIVGQMTNSAGDEHAFLLTPTPLKIAIDNIKEAIVKKLNALETIAAALEQECLAYDALEELLESGNYGDLKKSDVVKAKQKIHSAIQHEEQAETAVDQSIEKLDDALDALDIELSSD